MTTPHTMTMRGRKVRVSLKSGEVFFDRFIERTRGKVIVFASGRRVPCGDVKSFSDVRAMQPVHAARKIS